MSKAKPDTHERAKLEILNYITNFCLSSQYGDGRLYPGIEGFFSGMSDIAVEVGDLVALKSAPTSKWHLSWLLEIDNQYQPHGARYLLKSIHDGELCWWENVGLSYFPRDKLSPSWRWTDRQHEFYRRWNRVCRDERDAYITLPTPPIFGDGFEVTIGTRIRFGLGDERPTRSFPDWRKVTKAQMLAFYDDAVREREAAQAARRAALDQGMGE